MEKLAICGLEQVGVNFRTDEHVTQNRQGKAFICCCPKPLKQTSSKQAVVAVTTDNADNAADDAHRRSEKKLRALAKLVGKCGNYWPLAFSQPRKVMVSRDQTPTPKQQQPEPDMRIVE